MINRMTVDFNVLQAISDQKFYFFEKGSVMLCSNPRSAYFKQPLATIYFSQISNKYPDEPVLELPDGSTVAYVNATMSELALFNASFGKSVYRLLQNDQGNITGKWITPETKDNEMVEYAKVFVSPKGNFSGTPSSCDLASLREELAREFPRLGEGELNQLAAFIFEREERKSK